MEEILSHSLLTAKENGVAYASLPSVKPLPRPAIRSLVNEFNHTHETCWIHRKEYGYFLEVNEVMKRRRIDVIQGLASVARVDDPLSIHMDEEIKEELLTMIYATIAAYGWRVTKIEEGKFYTHFTLTR